MFRHWLCSMSVFALPGITESLQDRRVRLFVNFLDAHTWSQLHQPEPIWSDVENAEIGDDSVHSAYRREWHAALPEYPGGAILRAVLHEHHHASDTGDQVHRPSHAFCHLSRYHPVRQIALFGDLHSAQ